MVLSLFAFFSRHSKLANIYYEAQLDLERWEKNANKERTMMMWKNAFQNRWDQRPIHEVQKLFDLQPMIMRAIIEAEGERTKF